MFKVVLAVLVVVVIIAAAVPLYVGLRYERVVERRLPEWVARATDTLYRVTVEDVSISLFSKNITVRGLRIFPDSAKVAALKAKKDLPPTLFRLKVQRLSLKSIEWAGFIADRNFSCKALQAAHPELVVEKVDAALVSSEKPAETRRDLRQLQIDEIELLKPDIKFTTWQASHPQSFHLKGGRVRLLQWLFDPSAPRDSSLFFYARSGSIDFDSAIITQYKQLYNLQTGRVHFSTPEKKLVIRDLDVKPLFSSAEFYKASGHGQELFTVRIPNLTAEGFNWEDISKGRFILRALNLRDPYLRVYLDRHYPRDKEKQRLIPSQTLLKAAFPISVDTVHVANATIRYVEKSDKTGQEGTVPFDKCWGTITNVTNLPEQRAQHAVCRADLKGMAWGSKLSAAFQFNLQQEGGSFEAHIQQGPLEGQRVNELTRALALIEIASLKLQSADVNLRFDGHRLRGSSTVRYNDLKLKLLKEDEGELDRRGILSLVVNKALIYPDNPMEGEKVRQVTPAVTKGRTQSFFNLLWSALRRGLLLTAGRNDGLADFAEKKGK